MSIRLRLTLLYTAILALALIGFSLLAYFSVARDGLEVQTNTLAVKARRISTAAEFALTDIDALAALFAGPEVYVQTRNRAAEVLDRTQNLNELTLPLERSNLSGINPDELWREVAVVGNERLLIYNKPIVTQGQVGGVLQLASSLTDREQSLARFRNLLLISNLLISAAAFAIGWALAGLGLRPIQRITEAARVIGANRDFSRRVEQGQARDEVGQLAVTFNATLAALQDAHQQTEEALSAQRRFVADASHELRTPLTTIRGNIGLLQRTPPISDDDRSSVMQDMVDESDRLIRLVNDLLTLARRDAGQPLQRESFSVQLVFREVERQAKLLAPERPIICEACPEAMAHGNRDALKQVLLILLDNAFKHTPPQAAIMLTSLENAHSVTVKVCDSGPGIEERRMPYLFDRFYQIEPARNKVGLGLGLAIAKALVEAQGGQIAVESEWGRGSTFSVVLPKAS